MFQHSGQLAGSLIAGLFIAQELSSKPLVDLSLFMISIVGVSILSTLIYFHFTESQWKQ
jgi:hypothetical protein